MNKITYDNKETINPQPSVANKNKVSASDMNEIKNCLNAVIDTTTYSTNEIVVGTWIDGKPIYRKTKEFNSSSTTFNLGQENALNMDISNIDEVINYKAFYKRSDNSFQQVPNCHSSMDQWGSSIYDIKTNGSCTFWVGALASTFTINYLVITLEYTKTTD